VAELNDNLSLEQGICVHIDQLVWSRDITNPC